MIDPNYTFFIQLISFIIFLAVMSKFVYGPVREFLDERTRKNNALRDAASFDREETEKIKEKYSGMLAEAREEALAIRNDMLSASKKSASEELEIARTEQERKRADGFASLEKERADAQQILQKEIDSLSEDIVKKVLIS